MSSASKALSLLSCFSTSRPEIGLSHLCRIAGRDKATTYRHLQALETVGFIEQNSMTKHYRLGPAVLQLAQIREATVPRKEATKAPLQKLANATGETAHVTVVSGTTLHGLCEFESPRHSTRAVIDLNTFPLHATASGLCALTFGGSELFDAALSNLESFTESTLISAAELKALTDGFKTTGIARADRSFENEIQGTATALFDHAGHLIGTVAVACVASRFTNELEEKINAQLILASREITRNWGGSIPDNVESAWANTALPALETA